MVSNFKLIIEYDGTAYHGWQHQGALPTIQAEIEKALARISGGRVRVFGSGRTDAGVHAFGQVASLALDTRLGSQELQRALNSLLPADIVIRHCSAAEPAFHARYSAKSKTYHYRILNRAVAPAVGRQYVWAIRHPLDRAAMRAAIPALLGRHDFKAFEGAGSPRAHSVREVMSAELTETAPDELLFAISADGFLRGMVRNIVGTLAEVGRGRRPPADVARILASRDRRAAGITAPPQGLFLAEVRY
jgi:tRNA pseudouridine38-40 synthase